MTTPQEDLLGVIWNICLSHNTGFGYGLVITSQRVVGAKKTPWLSTFDEYLGPGSGWGPDKLAQGRAVADELIASKEFEFRKEDIARISFKPAGLLSDGHAIFKTDSSEIQVGVVHMPRNDFLVGVTSQNLELSLAAFAPDRAYDEDTGVLLQEKLAQKRAREGAEEESLVVEA